MSYRAVITGPCEHDGMAFQLYIEQMPGWPNEVGLLNAGGKEVVYPLLDVEAVPFDLGRNENVLLTARYGPKPAEVST